MPDIQTLTYTNGKNLLVGCSNKSGSSSAIAVLGYPLLGKIKYRKERINLFKKGIWKEYTFENVFKTSWNDYPIRVAIIRDPIERFVSSYRDRVLKRNKDGTREYIKTFDYYLENIDDIRNRSRDIRNHTQSQVDSIGPNLENYTHIILTKNIDTEFVPLVEDISGTKNIPFFKEKNSSKAPQVELTQSQINKIKILYKEDYIAFKNINF